jgi:hypothetical protein
MSLNNRAIEIGNKRATLGLKLRDARLQAEANESALAMLEEMRAQLNSGDYHAKQREYHETREHLACEMKKYKDELDKTGLEFMGVITTH